MTNVFSSTALAIKTNPDTSMRLLSNLGEAVSLAATVSKFDSKPTYQKALSTLSLAVTVGRLGKSIVAGAKELISNSVILEEDEYAVRLLEGSTAFSIINSMIAKNLADKTEVPRDAAFEVYNAYYDDEDEIADFTASKAEAFKNDNAIVYAKESTEYAYTSEVVTLGENEYTVNLVTPSYDDDNDPSDDDVVVNRQAVRRKKRMRILLQPYMLIRCSSLENRQKFLTDLAEFASERFEENRGRRSSSFSIASKTGSYNHSEIPMRSRETVILHEGQMEEIISGLRRFLSHEEIYSTLGVPYHHGILLKGPPGTGKSSTAQAIAAELGLRTYSVSLANLDNDDALATAIRNIQEKSVLLLEDIDATSVATTRDSAEKTDGATGVSLSGLLQVLDGAQSPHGVIIIMTTNHIERLDHAVVRPGRVDSIYDIGFLTDYQLRKLCKSFMKIDDVDLKRLPSVDGLEITPAEIISLMKPHIPEVKNAFDDIIAFVLDKSLVTV